MLAIEHGSVTGEEVYFQFNWDLTKRINEFKMENISTAKVSHTTQAYKDFLLAIKTKN